MKQLKILIVLVLCLGWQVNAQTKLKKPTQTLKVEKDVTIDLNTSYTNIEIDTWNKGTIEVEAIVESDDLDKESLQKLLDAWTVKVNGGGDNVTISTNNQFPDNYNWNYEFIDDEVAHALKSLHLNLDNMPEIPPMPELPALPEMNFDFPEMPEAPEFPELPELPEGVNTIKFDVDKYKAEGEAYLEKWSKEYEKKYGKEYKDKMKAWAKEFSKADFDAYSKEMEEWGKQFGKQFDEKWAKDYEKKMEEWGKQYEKQFSPEWEAQMEAWGEQFGKEFAEKYEKRAERMEVRAAELEKRAEELEKRAEEREIRALELSKRFDGAKGKKVKKTLKIKMPKNAKLKVNVRHGELKFATNVHNLRADLQHSTLFATSIDGSNTSINASYSPVFVENWNSGELQLNYVKDVTLKRVKGLMLSSNSSDVVIEVLEGNAAIDGSFGELTIKEILDSFNNINIILENSDALIALPKVAYNLQFKGNRSKLKHPEKTVNYKNETYVSGDVSSNKMIVINAKFSDVTMQ